MTTPPFRVSAGKHGGRNVPRVSLCCMRPDANPEATQCETKIAYKAIVFISREIRIQTLSTVWCIPRKVGRFRGWDRNSQHEIDIRQKAINYYIMEPSGSQCGLKLGYQAIL